MKILGSVLIPDEGELFFAPHLRVFHVPQEPLFFDRSLLENLQVGTAPDRIDIDASIARVSQICQMIGVPQKVIDSIPSDEVRQWSDVLSSTEKVLLHLARALIANPEAIVAH